MTSALLVSLGASSSAFTELAGDAVEGTYMVTGKVWVADQLPASDPQKPVLESFIRSYRSRYGQDPSPIAGMAYDCMLLLAKALEKAGPQPTRASVRDALEQLGPVVGISGVFHITSQDHQGLTEADLVIARMSQGRWQLIDYRAK